MIFLDTTEALTFLDHQLVQIVTGDMGQQCYMDASADLPREDAVGPCRAAETGGYCIFFRVSLHEFYAVLIEKTRESAEKVSLQVLCGDCSLLSHY